MTALLTARSFDIRRAVRSARTFVMALVCASAMPVTAAAQSLADLSLEDLMQIDAGQVFGASERLQPSIEAPASVSFITAQEIQRFGYRTLADILRSVRGMYVTNDRNFSYIGARGFGKPGDYNSRILLLINGHRVNDNIFGQAEIGAEFGLDPATFERVEVIRGPASSLYGDSAFFAVVNVITRSGDSLNGTATTVETGTLGTGLFRASTGRRLSNGLDYIFSTTVEHSDGIEKLYFPAFDTPDTNNGIAEGLDGEGVKQFYGRMAFKGLSVTTMYGTRQRDIPTASLQTVFNEQAWHEQGTDRHGLVDALYGRSFGETRLTLRGSYDRFTFSGIYPMAVEPDGTPTLVGEATGVGARWSGSAGVTQPLPGRQILRAGVEYIDNISQDRRGGFVGDPIPALFDLKESSQQQALYVQDEIKISRWFIFNGGLRYDKYEQFDRVTPRAAFIFMPSSAQSFKYLFGNAFRAPNGWELNDFYFGERVHTLRPESIDTHEVVWERYFNDRLRTATSAYWYKADRLITPALDDSTFLGATFVNQGEVRAKGLEMEAQIRLRGESRALVSYAIQSAVDQQTGDELPNSPRHVAKGRISLPGPIARSFVSLEAQYLSSRGTVPRFDGNGNFAAGRVKGAAVANLTLVQPLGRAWELSGGLRNLFDAKYADPVSDQHVQEAVEQNGRTARIGLTWKFSQGK
jgi:outer membrane receptor for ferrienterochelin and colicins